MPVWIGTSGWQYASWRGGIYPEKLPQRLWLEHYIERFDVVEVNNTFYRLPERSVFEQWRERAPERFRYVLKISRYLTHTKRLRDPVDALSRFLENAEGLDGRCGPLLLQLPPRFNADAGRLRDALAVIPQRYQVAVEVRDESWFSADVRAVLEARDAPLVLADRDEVRLEPDPLPHASWAYIRFHSGRNRPPTCYRPSRLQEWAEFVAATYPKQSDVYVFFNNDPFGCAVRDAVRFASFCRDAGLDVTRVPEEAEARLTG